MAQVFKFEPESALGYKVFVATPSTSGATSPAYQVSLLRSIEKAKACNIGVTWCMLAWNCHVDDSRNFLVREFLESDCDVFFFIDADMGWDEDDFIKQVETEKQVVGGIYPKKSDSDNEWPVRLPKGELWTDDHGWLEIHGLPTGFLAMKREAVQALYDAEPQKYNVKKDKDRIKQAIIFERTYKDGARTGGDYAMCDKWAALGGKMYTDPGMRFSHEGTKQWAGRLEHHLMQKHGLLENQITELLHKIEQGYYNGSDIAKLYEAWANGKWTSSPEILTSMVLMLDKGEYTTVLELGAGLSTLIIAAIAKRKGFYFESVEQDKQCFFMVRRYLDLMGYKSSLVLAPVVDGWYDYTPGSKFDFVFCDGPCRRGEGAGIRNEITRIKWALESAVLMVDDFDNSFGEALPEFNFTPYHTFAVGVK